MKRQNHPSDVLAAPDGLAERLADLLRTRIERGDWPAQARLPTEQELVERHGVSRTVVREAISRLKSMGLLVSRQGSGVYVAPPSRARALAFDPSVLDSLDAVVQVVEVRRALEGEVAALAAQRASDDDLARIFEAVGAIDVAVAAGGDGVEEDLHFHRTVAAATGNLQFNRLLAYLDQYQRDATKITRANEAMNEAYMQQVRAEHREIAQAIAARDAERARRAATAHMLRAARRIEETDASVRAVLADALTSRTGAAGALR